MYGEWLILAGAGAQVHTSDHRGRQQEQGRHAASKIRRAVSTKKAVKESKRGNIAAVRKRLKSQSQKRS